jgi:hypothetical protein
MTVNTKVREYALDRQVGLNVYPSYAQRQIPCRKVGSPTVGAST